MLGFLTGQIIGINFSCYNISLSESGKVNPLDDSKALFPLLSSSE